MDTVLSTTLSPSASGRLVAGRPIWLVSAGTALAAAVATELYGLVARAAGIPMAAGNAGAAVAEPVTVGMFAMGTLICSFWGTLLALALARWATRPARAFLATTVTLVVISLAFPLTAGATATSTKLMLAGPVVTRRLRAVRRPAPAR